MSKLITHPNIADGDGFYADLLTGHEGLSEEQANQMNARLVLLLSNHIGDQDVLREAIDLARKSSGTPS